MAGGDGALLLAKSDSRGSGVERSDFCVRRFVAIADTDFRVYDAVGDLVRNPVHVVDFARGAVKLAIVSHYEAILCAIERNYVHRTTF